MEQISAFFAMGGYGAFVWPAFAITAAVMGGLLAVSLRRLRAREAELEALRAAREEATEAGDET